MNLIYDEHEGQGVYVKNYGDVTPFEFREQISEFLMSGYEVRENKTDRNSIAILKKGNDLVLIAYYPTIKEMRVVTEPNSSYFSFKDTPCNEKTDALITQIDLEDFGLSYAIRLLDGRFIIFDGGWEFEPDADKLMAVLSEQSPYEKPIIAAWIMTHPHIDHYRCYLAFHKKYADAVVIERFIYNFPDAEPDEERLPDIMKRYKNIERFFLDVNESGAKVYKAHTGQVYELGGAKMEVLSSPDDTYVVPIRCFNTQSLVIKMTLAGQTILWTADCYLKEATLAERWGDYLKSDILQAPHHLFTGGDKETYALIDPNTCLVPDTEELCFGTISMHVKSSRDNNRYLFFDLNVQDFFVGGGGNVTIKLPYTPRTNGRKLYLDKIEKNQKELGASSWFFDSVTSDTCEFTIINAIREDAVIFADLLFENSSNTVFNIKITVPKISFKKVNLLDCENADPDALYFNRDSLAKKGIPEGAEFAIHFKANMPVVIIGKKSAAYHS
jgi:hypothetical protein